MGKSHKIVSPNAKKLAKTSLPRLETKPPEEQMSLLSYALSSLRDAVVITDRSHRIIYANPAIESIQGYKPPEVIGKKAYDMFENIPGNPPDLARLIGREAKEGFWIGEVVNRRRNGTYFPVQLIVNTIFGKTGRVLGYVGISRDISEREKIEKELRSTENKIKATLRALADLLFIFDREGRFTYCHAPPGSKLYTPPDRFIGKKVCQVLPPPVCRLFRDAFRENQKGKIAGYEYSLPFAGGELWFSARLSPIYLKGEFSGSVAVVRDITRRKEEELALLRYSFIYSSMDEAVIVSNRKGITVDVNPAAEKLYEWTRREMLGRSPEMLKSPRKRLRIRARIEKGLRENGIWQGKLNLITRSGRERTVSTIVSCLRDSEGRWIGNFSIDRDISERQKAEEHLRESEARYRSTMECLGLPLTVIDRDFKVVLNNQALRRWNAELGFPAEMIGKNIFKYYPFLSPRIRKEYRQVFREGRILITEEVSRLNGRDIITETRKIPVIEGGKVIRVTAIIHDITETRQSETRLREASKLEAVGSLTLGIAHEFNNLLMGISGYSQLAREDLSNSKMVEKAFNVVLQQADRGRDLIQRLSSLARRSRPHPVPVDLSKVLDEVITLQDKFLLLSGIRIKKNYHHPASVFVDYAQIEQVLFNLISNARQAITRKKTGLITLTTRNKGKTAEVRVTDNGVGIPRKIIPLIYTPFFSTKKSLAHQPALNLGLGLWVCRQIVEENGGTISVESRRGEGTTFTVAFPQRAASSSPVPPAAANLSDIEDDLRGKRGLIVDDEKEILKIWDYYLRREGAVIRCASSGEAALRLCQREKFDFICLDYIMPGLTGKQLLLKIKRAAPESRIVVVSGKLFSDPEKKELAPYLDSLLLKPLNLEELRQALT